MSALDEALKLERSGQLDAAVIALEAMLVNSAAQPLALAYLAEVQLKRGRPADAAMALDRAEEVAGTTAFTARLRGDVAYQRERWEEASKAYRDADALGDQGTWSLVQLARCRLRLRDVEGARGAASRTVERHPDSPAGWIILGDIAQRQDALAEAEAMYVRAHERAPEDEWAYAKLVEVRLLQLPPERRTKEITVLLKTLGKENRHLLGVAARIRSRDGDDVAAAQAWGERSRRTGDFYARKMQGFALRKAGRLDDAAAVLGACLVDKPDDVILFRTYVSMQRGRGATEELRRTLEQAMPDARSRRGAFIGELRKLAAPETDGASADLAAAQPATQPATQPTTKPAPAVAPDARS